MKVFNKLSIIVITLIILLSFVSCNKNSSSNNLVLDKTNSKQFNMFFSNFSEVDLLPFAGETLEDRKMIIFSIKHILLNEPKLIEASDEKDTTGKISTKSVDVMTLKYFGKNIKNHETVLVGQYGNSKNIVTKYCTYKDGYYYIPTTSNKNNSIVYGESRSFSLTNSIIDNKDGTLTADISIYSIQEDNVNFKSDPFTTTPEEWKKTTSPEYLPTYVGNMTAKIKKEKDGRYILIEYKNKQTNEG